MGWVGWLFEGRKGMDVRCGLREKERWRGGVCVCVCGYGLESCHASGESSVGCVACTSSGIPTCLANPHISSLPPCPSVVYLVNPLSTCTIPLDNPSPPSLPPHPNATRATHFLPYLAPRLPRDCTSHARGSLECARARARVLLCLSQGSISAARGWVGLTRVWMAGWLASTRVGWFVWRWF
ncbi:uncharacterized protein IWZ02DRAFT_58950 [Phyllosticta citriasiana]|uniref:uncharacterized protein n=1 Tax=Phyllosticta citriasiana TaxID=595635 RepID=UPI0030FDC143